MIIARLTKELRPVGLVPGSRLATADAVVATGRRALPVLACVAVTGGADSWRDIPLAPANLRCPALDGRLIARRTRECHCRHWSCLMSPPLRGKVHMATDIAH